MKYTKGWVAPKGDLSRKVSITSKAYLPKHRKISIGLFVGAIGLSIYGIADNFFRAGVEGHDIGECEALNKIGAITSHDKDERADMAYEASCPPNEE